MATVEVDAKLERIVVKAYDYASAYDLRVAREKLEKPLDGRVVTPDPLQVQFDLHKVVMVFKFGSVVFFNVDPTEIQHIMEQLKICAHRENKHISEDDFVLYLSSQEKRPEGTEEWYIEKFSRDIALVVGIVLARSVSLEYYERLVDEALAQFEQTIDKLALKGWIPHRHRDAAKHIGFALAVEHELAYDVAIFDDPEVVWDGGANMGQLYYGLKREFELEQRIKVIQQKVSIISRFSTFVLSRLEAQRSAYLEWIIIILIFSEILLALLAKIPCAPG
jgi:uncharacterized Rmd1/YagE family protein